ncbi:MAG: glycosyltransferase family 39 protein [candidate division Zixibacteria bacterium]
MGNLGKDKIASHPALVLILGTVLYLCLGFAQPGMNFDSATYSVIARNMVDEGRWFNPTYTDFYLNDFVTHPPLVMWANAVVFSALGANDSTARLFGALCTLGAIIAAFSLGKEIGGKSYGFLSGLVLLLTYNFIQNGNSGLLDVPLSFFMLVVLWGIARMQNSNLRWKPHIIAGVALGCAFLSKGVVSAPVWATLVAIALFIRRDWLRSYRFWCIPGIAILLVSVYLVMDQIYAGGVFLRSYFFHQIWNHWIRSDGQTGSGWWFFTYRFAQLYLPFIVLLPVGMYMMVRKKVILLFPAAITLIVFFLFSSAATVLYHHYFCPAYALSAPVIALPLYYLLKKNHVQWLTVGFAIVWLSLGVGVTAAGVRIHTVRAPEIYNARESLQSLLRDHPTRYGIFVHPGNPRWNYVANTAWYWRSDIKQLSSIEEAALLLRSDMRFAYLFVESMNRLTGEEAKGLHLSSFLEADGIVVYISVGGVSGKRAEYYNTQLRCNFP